MNKPAKDASGAPYRRDFTVGLHGERHFAHQMWKNRGFPVESMW
jgi:hypothetical protein